MKLIKELSLINGARQRLGRISLEFYLSLFPPELRLVIIYEWELFFDGQTDEVAKPVIL